MKLTKDSIINSGIEQISYLQRITICSKACEVPDHCIRRLLNLDLKTRMLPSDKNTFIIESMRSSEREKERFFWVRICIILSLSITTSCALYPKPEKSVIERDFIDSLSFEQRDSIAREIEETVSKVERDFSNAELHRRLSVLYRMQGTPRSRLQSSEEIDRAIMLDPGNAIYRVEQGLTYSARRFVGEARKAFLEATKIDPRCAEAWYQLGVLERDEYLESMCFPDILARSIDYFLEAYKYRRNHEKTLLNLGFLYSLRSMHRTGLRYAERAATLYPRNPQAHLLCGMLYTKISDFDRAKDSFEKGLALLGEQEREIYENISILLSTEERELYESSLPAKKKDWNRRFWIEQDPTPSTDINERLLEHYSRVFIAQKTLSNERLAIEGVATDRGKALVRFGPPDKTYFDLGTGQTGGWIIWGYNVPGGQMRLYFNDEFLNGNFHFPISDYSGELSRKMLQTAPARYEFPIRYVSIPMAIEMAERRGSQELTRIDFSIAVPDSLPIKKGERWDLSLTFFDRELYRFARRRFSFDPDSIPRIEKSSVRYALVSSSMEVLRRELGCTCVAEIALEKSRLKGARRYELDMKDLFGRSLKLSSMRFTLKEREGCSEFLDPIPAYTPGESLCLGYEVYNLEMDAQGTCRYRVSYAIRRPQSKDEEPASLRRTLSYMLESVRGKKNEERPFVESSFEQLASSRTVSDRLSIDLAALEPGIYELTLLVEDLSSGQTASDTKRFTIRD